MPRSRNALPACAGVSFAPLARKGVPKLARTARTSPSAPPAYPLEQVDVERIEAHPHRLHREAPDRLRLGEDQLDVCRRGRHGLLDEDVLARLQRFERDLEVGVGGRRDVDDVYLGAREQFVTPLGGERDPELTGEGILGSLSASPPDGTHASGATT